MTAFHQLNAPRGEAKQRSLTLTELMSSVSPVYNIAVWLGLAYLFFQKDRASHWPGGKAVLVPLSISFISTFDRSFDVTP
ncbi:hypothetical protein BLNAU_3753 [Blattamonas nauphoetae]|uniref:Uncharacterized protein n=1 Tax=Blattamonas nauphoetae TaxID=2049346 RepID=A0ABQ9YC17_9EUKA|nr:hypothetical protein BLNAU_3753 [Blattamonas nauphoetae]